MRSVKSVATGSIMYRTSGTEAVAVGLRKALLLAGCTIALIPLAGFAPGDTPGPLDISRVQEAIVRQIRFQMYWWGREDEYRPGANLRMEVASDGHRFLAMIDDFELMPDGRRMVAFFRGVQAEERTWILQFSGTPVARGDVVSVGDWWTKLEPGLDQLRTVHGELAVPTDLSRRVAPASTPTWRMRDAILSSMQEQLSWNVARRGESLPNLVSLVVADFDVEDPTTFVLVEENNKVYEVYLYDPGDPTDPRYRDGPFLVWPIEGRPRDVAVLRSKVKQFSLVHQLLLSSTTSEELTTVPTP